MAPASVGASVDRVRYRCLANFSSAERVIYGLSAGALVAGTAMLAIAYAPAAATASGQAIQAIGLKLAGSAVATTQVLGRVSIRGDLFQLQRIGTQTFLQKQMLDGTWELVTAEWFTTYMNWEPIFLTGAQSDYLDGMLMLAHLVPEGSPAITAILRAAGLQ